MQGNPDERGAELNATDQDVRLGGTLHRQDRGAQVGVTHTVKKVINFPVWWVKSPLGTGKSLTFFTVQAPGLDCRLIHI